MNCEHTTERLLSLPTGTRPEADLTTHLAGCPACTVVAARMRQVDSYVASLPVPDSTPRKAAFIASLTTGSHVRSTTRTWTRYTNNPTVRLIVALAAAVLVAVSAFSLWPRNDSTKKEFAATKHELLKHSVAFASEQGKQPSSATRMQSATTFAGHILAEVKGVYQATKPNDENALAVLSDLFDRTIREGVTDVASNNRTLNPQDRTASLNPLMPALAGYEQACRELQLSAPNHVKPYLAHMTATASAASKTLVALGASSALPQLAPSAAGLDAGREMLAMKANSAVIEVLTNRGLKAGTTADSVDRADEVRAGAASIHLALTRAVNEGDAERAAEMGEHLATMLEHGVKPAVELAAKDGSNVNSPSFDRVKALQARAKGDAARARAALPIEGRLADDSRIIKARKLLDAAADAL